MTTQNDGLKVYYSIIESLGNCLSHIDNEGWGYTFTHIALYESLAPLLRDCGEGAKYGVLILTMPTDNLMGILNNLDSPNEGYIFSLKSELAKYIHWYDSPKGVLSLLKQVESVIEDSSDDYFVLRCYSMFNTKWGE